MSLTRVQIIETDPVAAVAVDGLRRVLAGPGPNTQNMMDTPASVFDLFLFRVYEGAKCNKLVKNNNADEADLCMTSLDYDVDANLLSAYFRVYPGAEAMEDFVDEDAAGRKRILLRLLDNTASRVGAQDGWGLLHSIPLSLGNQVGGEREKAFRRELAARTSTALTTSYDGRVYRAVRHYDGRVEYSTNP